MAVIESVDLYYLSMPVVEDVGDGSQDVLLVRVRAGEWEGWGECEASPLVSIASLVAPMSHSACHPVADSVLGRRIDSVADVRAIGAEVRARSFDQLQAAHTLSGIDIALCDLLGRRYEEPVWRLLGFEKAYPKTPYASALFGETPEQTHDEAARLAGLGYRAVKFGWQGFGAGTAAADDAQLEAARSGLGPDIALAVDAGMAWGTDAAAALERVEALQRHGVLFLEEAFVPEAYPAYQQLAAATKGRPALAGGEGCHNVSMAIAMMGEAELSYVQIDAGRIGGITPAAEVAEVATRQGRTYVNHTFTSHLALSASLQPFAGLDGSPLCEYPVAPKAVSYDLTRDHLERDADGLINVPDAPGLGLVPDPATIARYLQQVEITVGGRVLYRTPEIPTIASDLDGARA